MEAPLSFTAAIISGAGRGKKLGFPTFNLDLRSIPEELEDGVYAVRAKVDEEELFLLAVMHFGPRPTFDASTSCEVHLLEQSAGSMQQPTALTVEVFKRLRGVRRFESAEALKKQLMEDSAEARSLLQ